MFFDGSKRKNGCGGGAMLVSPYGERYYAAFRFSFACSNNIAKFEDLTQSLEWAKKKGVECIKVYGDNELYCQPSKRFKCSKE